MLEILKTRRAAPNSVPGGSFHGLRKKLTSQASDRKSPIRRVILKIMISIYLSIYIYMYIRIYIYKIMMDHITGLKHMVIHQFVS